MIIRQRQNDAFASIARDEFTARMEKHLRKFFGPVVEPLSPEQLHAVVERNWAAAEAHGLGSELGVCMYLNAVLVLGEDFPKKQPAIAKTLQDVELPEEKKRQRLDEWVRAELQQLAARA